MLLCWSMMSEADVGSMAVQVEPSHQYSITFCCCVTDGSRGVVQQNGVWNAQRAASLCSHTLFSLNNHSAGIYECQWVPLFWMEEFSSTPLLHPHFHVRCHTLRLLPLLPSVTQQQNVMEYWQEGSASTAVPPPFVSDITGQHNKRGSITLRAALHLPRCKLIPYWE